MSSAVNFEVGVYFSPDEMSPIYPKLEDLVNGVNVNETRNSSMNLDSEVVASFQWKTPILAGIAVLLNLLTFGRIIYYYVRAHSLFKFSHYHKWVIPITSTSQKSWKYLFFINHDDWANYSLNQFFNDFDHSSTCFQVFGCQMESSASKAKIKSNAILFLQVRIRKFLISNKSHRV